MTRIFIWAAIAAPAILVGLLMVGPSTFAPIVGVVPSSVVMPIVGAISGVWLTATLGYMYYRMRLAPLASATERIAAGEESVAVPVRGVGEPARLARAINTLSGALAAAREEATTDRLTGVPSRQALLASLFTETDRARRYSRPLAVAFLDIDHFKAINDTYGHAFGDLVLRGVAQTIQGSIRATDTFGRYGGEEFMLLMTETDADDGAQLAEKLRHLVAGHSYQVPAGPTVSVTISIGVAGGIGTSLQVDALVRDADAAMYTAKSLGRNQTFVFAEPDEDSRVPRAPISAVGRARAIEVGRSAREAAAAALTAVISPLPHYRGQPSALIASIVTAMAKALDLPEQEIDRVRIAALLHDVGKVAVPQEILDKPAALTTAEWQSVVQHPRIGQVILDQATMLRDAAPIILHHHERYSGHGYPHGLRGNDIPLGARIVSIADAYDAMTHDRPYKAAISHDQAIRELRRHAGTQFDPELVSMFCDLYTAEAPVPDPSVLVMNGEAHGVDTSDRPAASPAPARPRRRAAPGAAQSAAG